MVACPSLKYDVLSVYWYISALYMDFVFDRTRSTMKVGNFKCHERSVTGDSPVFCNRCVLPADDSNHNEGDCVFS